MTPDQFETAKPIISRIQRIREAIDKAKPLAIGDWSDPNSQFSKPGTSSQYSIFVGLHSDLSGPKIDMAGCNVAEKVWKATYKILQEELVVLEARLAEI